MHTRTCLTIVAGALWLSGCGGARPDPSLDRIRVQVGPGVDHQADEDQAAGDTGNVPQESPPAITPPPQPTVEPPPAITPPPQPTVEPPPAITPPPQPTVEPPPATTPPPQPTVELPKISYSELERSRWYCSAESNDVCNKTRPPDLYEQGTDTFLNWHWVERNYFQLYGEWLKTDVWARVRWEKIGRFYGAPFIAGDLPTGSRPDPNLEGFSLTYMGEMVGQRTGNRYTADDRPQGMVPSFRADFEVVFEHTPVEGTYFGKWGGHYAASNFRVLLSEEHENSGELLPLRDGQPRTDIRPEDWSGRIRMGNEIGTPSSYQFGGDRISGTWYGDDHMMAAGFVYDRDGDGRGAFLVVRQPSAQ